MGIYFTGGERLQRGRGIGGILKAASKLFAPLASIAKRAVSSDVGKKVVNAVKNQAIESSINIAKDLADGGNIKNSLKNEFGNVKQKSKRKAFELGVEYLQNNKKRKIQKNKKNKNKKIKKDIFQ